MRTALLLGAGSSIPAGFPSTSKLTKIVRSGRGVTRGSDSSYYIDVNSADLQEGTTATVIKLVNHLHEVQRQYYEHYGLNGIPNYEDIAYLISQGCEQWKGELDNPVVLSFIDRLRSDLSSEVHELEQNDDFKTCISHTGHEDMLASLLEESLNYIVDIVWRCLWGNPNSVSQLGVIKHICESSCVSSISTLCHDTHLETFLRDEGIGLADGFKDTYDAGIRYWNGGFSSKGSIPFLKLHGSIDWFELYPHGGTIYDYKVGLVSDELDCQRLQDGSGEWLDTTGRPMLLIGTFNKISQYSAGIFRDLHCCFRSTLNNANQLIVCGYGFGDKGINSEIIGWVSDSRRRRIIVLHPEPDDLLSNARPAIRNNWIEWEKHDSISVVKKCLEDVSVSDLSF